MGRLGLGIQLKEMQTLSSSPPLSFRLAQSQGGQAPNLPGDGFTARTPYNSNLRRTRPGHLTLKRTISIWTSGVAGLTATTTTRGTYFGCRVFNNTLIVLA